MLKLALYVFVAWLITAIGIGIVIGVKTFGGMFYANYGIPGVLSLFAFVVATIIAYAIWADDRVKK